MLTSEKPLCFFVQLGGYQTQRHAQLRRLLVRHRVEQPLEHRAHRGVDVDHPVGPRAGRGRLAAYAKFWDASRSSVSHHDPRLCLLARWCPQGAQVPAHLTPMFMPTRACHAWSKHHEKAASLPPLRVGHICICHMIDTLSDQATASWLSAIIMITDENRRKGGQNVPLSIKIAQYEVQRVHRPNPRVHRFPAC